MQLYSLSTFSIVMLNVLMVGLPLLDLSELGLHIAWRDETPRSLRLATV